MKAPTLIMVVTLSIIISACGSGDTSGGVGSTSTGYYKGTIQYSGYNTCGLHIPESGTFYMTIVNDSIIFDPIGLTWAGGRGSVTLKNALQGSKIKVDLVGRDPRDWNYSYRMDGRIKDGGATISGTGYIEGVYANGTCAEKFAGVFAGVRYNK